MEHLTLIIQVAGAITALGIIFATFKIGHRWIMQLKWLFSEQHDHEVIKDALEKIKKELTENGGSGTLKDAVCDIRDSLAFNSSYMRVLHHTNPKAVFETDENGHVVYVNRAFTRMTEFSQHEVMDMGWVNLIAPHSREKVIKMWMGAVESQRDFDEIVPYIKPDGTEYPVHAIAHTIRVAGDMVGHLGEIIPVNAEL